MNTAANTTRPTLSTSPWGHVERERIIAPGIIQVSTASHGGIYLTPLRVHQMKDKIPGFIPFAGYPWLEEDCDFCAVPLVWPEYFDAFTVRSCVRYALSDMGRQYAPALAAYLNTEGRALVGQANDWDRQHWTHWERSGCCTRGGGWLVWFRRVGDGAHLERWFRSYPGQVLWTDYELERVSEPAHRHEDAEGYVAPVSEPATV